MHIRMPLRPREQVIVPGQMGGDRRRQCAARAVRVACRGCGDGERRVARTCRRIGRPRSRSSQVTAGDQGCARAALGPPAARGAGHRATSLTGSPHEGRGLSRFGVTSSRVEQLSPERGNAIALEQRRCPSCATYHRDPARTARARAVATLARPCGRWPHWPACRSSWRRVEVVRRRLRSGPNERRSHRVRTNDRDVF